jgi:hypothetical protein
MAKYNSSGWHFQSDRHSKARRTGHAGGTYESERIRAIVEKHPEYKNLTFKQLKNKGVFLKYQADADKDGTPNIRDCRPLNKKAQDDGKSAGWYDIGHEEPKKLEFERIEGTNLLKEKEPSKKSKLVEDAKKAGRFVEKEIILGAKKTGEFIEKETKKLDEELKRRREKAQIEKEAKKEQLEEFRLQEVNSVLKEEVSDEKEIDIKTLSEEELKQLAVITPRGLFGGDTKYEHELKRRIDEEARLKGDLIIEKANASKKVEERIDEAKGEKQKFKYIWEK